MKKIVALLVLALALPPLTAYAASTTSRHFVVKNWKAPLSSTPASTEEPVDEQAGEIEPENEQPSEGAAETRDRRNKPISEEQGETGEPEEVEPSDEDIPPDLGPLLTTPPAPAFTDEVVVVEPEGEEQGEFVEEEPPAPASSVFTDEGEQGETEEPEEPGEEMK